MTHLLRVEAILRDRLPNHQIRRGDGCVNVLDAHFAPAGGVDLNDRKWWTVGAEPASTTPGPGWPERLAYDLADRLGGAT